MNAILPPSKPTAASPRDRDRMARLRAFLKDHDIRYPDIAEQLKAIEGKPLSLQRVHGMLCRNVYMEKAFRDRLLDLGFPEDVLPPERPVARFPGLMAGQDERRDAAAATA